MHPAAAPQPLDGFRVVLGLDCVPSELGDTITDAIGVSDSTVENNHAVVEAGAASTK
jgi:hypothetical protein